MLPSFSPTSINVTDHGNALVDDTVASVSIFMIIYNSFLVSAKVKIHKISKSNLFCVCLRLYGTDHLGGSRGKFRVCSRGNRWAFTGRSVGTDHGVEKSSIFVRKNISDSYDLGQLCTNRLVDRQLLRAHLLLGNYVELHSTFNAKHGTLCNICQHKSRFAHGHNEATAALF